MWLSVQLFNLALGKVVVASVWRSTIQILAEDVVAMATELKTITTGSILLIVIFFCSCFSFPHIKKKKFFVVIVVDVNEVLCLRKERCEVRGKV